MPYHLLVASYTEAITTLVFEPETSSINALLSLRAGHHPSWITQHPEDPHLIFTGLEQSDGVVLAIKYDDEWKGEVVDRASSNGADPCSLLVVKDELLIANYSSGSVSFIPISLTAPFFVDDPQTLSFDGSGPNADRQDAAHAHQVFLHHKNDELLVPDLGSDKVWRLKKGGDGSWLIQGSIAFEGGDGPRHVATYGEHVYTALELSNGVSKHKLPPLPADPSFVASASSLSQPLPSPNDMLVAEILIPKPNSAYPEPYIYVSNRNDPSPGGDTIAIFNLDLELVTEVRTGLNHIRGMMFGGPDDRWLVAGGARGGGVAIFERVDGGKGLKKIATNPDIEGPTGFLWV